MSDSNEENAIHCRATTSKGKQCRGYPLTGSEYCFTHSPDHAEQRAAAQRRGGENHRRPTNPVPFPDVDVASARGLKTFLEELIRDTWALPPSISRARTLAYLVRIQQDMLPDAIREAQAAALDARFNRS